MNIILMCLIANRQQEGCRKLIPPFRAIINGFYHFHGLLCKKRIASATSTSGSIGGSFVPKTSILLLCIHIRRIMHSYFCSIHPKRLFSINTDPSDAPGKCDEKNSIDMRRLGRTAILVCRHTRKQLGVETVAVKY